MEVAATVGTVREGLAWPGLYLAVVDPMLPDGDGTEWSGRSSGPAPRRPWPSWA